MTKAEPGRNEATVRGLQLDRPGPEAPMTTFAALPRTIARVTQARLTGALRTGGCLTRANVIAVAVRSIGREAGFPDGPARLRLTYDTDGGGAPPSVVVKIPSTE